jgi:hypothetical protein
MSNTNQQSMTVHSATFVTKRGDRRAMNFVRPDEAPKGVFPTYIRERKLQPGFETVWDVDRQQYRTFNNNTVVGSINSATKSVSVELF